MVRHLRARLPSAAYNDSANTITLTGTKFNEIDGYQNGSGVAQDIKAQLDWTKLSWDIDGDSDATDSDATTDPITFTGASDIVSAIVTSPTQLVITLDTAGIAKLHGTGNGVEGFGASSRGSTYPDADNIDITAGFISDDAGNVSTTDGKDNAVITYADAANAGAPTLLSFTTDATTGSFGVGDTINITANTSEPIVKGSIHHGDAEFRL